MTPRNRLNPTRNDLSKSTRSGAVERLDQLLADCIDLQGQCKQAHWNVKGPAFIALHKLFDEIHGAVAEYVDLIAERLVQLGGTAAGTVRSVAGRTTLPDYPLTITSGRDHAAALAGALANFGKAARRGIEEMTELEDAVSADMLTEVTRGTDQWVWFVEAHLQGK
jgi:starvation-inducible DNA-binding protein